MVPGTGDYLISLTLCEDIGKALVQLVLYQEKWPKFFNIAGETTTWNKIVSQAEKATKKKFQVEYVSKEAIEAKLNTSTDPEEQFNAIVDLAYVNGDIHIAKPSEEILKDVQFTTVEQLLKIYE